MINPRHFTALTIGSSDSGAGSGIQADLKTFAALDVYGTSVITAVAAQNTVEIAAIAEVPEEIVIAQIDTVIEDIGAGAIKTGVLVNRAIVQNVADRLLAWGVPFLVVDPELMSRSGVRLLSVDALDALTTEIIPQATIVTPNISEAELLSGRTISSIEDVVDAARSVHSLGPQIVVISCGRLPGPIVDLVFDGGEPLILESRRRDMRNTSGKGSTFSAAVTAFLAQGREPIEAIRLAKRYVEIALESSFTIGHGHSPINHRAVHADNLCSPTITE